MLHEVAAFADHGADERVAEIKLVARAGDRDVKKAAFLLFAVERLEGTRGREKTVAKHDEKDDVELETLRLMNRGESQHFVIIARGLVLLGFEIGQQGQLCQKILHAGKLRGEGCELF